MYLPVRLGKNIYVPYESTLDTKLREFHLLCVFLRKRDETLEHLFFYCATAHFLGGDLEDLLSAIKIAVSS